MDWKFKSSAKEFHETIDKMLAIGHNKKDLIHQFSAFAGATPNIAGLKYASLK